MRLFTAVTFDDEMKDSLCDIMNKLRPFTEKGNFTLRDNLHLTLNFIGETDKIKAAEQAMVNAVYGTGKRAFDITVKGFGRFKRREGDICWLGVEWEEHLFKLQKELADQLTKAGFTLEERRYTPHLTLARRVKFKGTFGDNDFGASIPELKQPVKKVSLMKSENISGKLTYTEIFSTPLVN